MAVPERVDDGTVRPEKTKKAKKEAEAAVRLRQVTKRFGMKTAVDSVSFSIDMGVVFGLIGPNGAGKTTTFSMMAGYLQPTEGSVEILGFQPRAGGEARAGGGVGP